MKKLSSISLFIFGVVVISILTAGLVFYQNNKDSQVAKISENTNLIQNVLSKNGTPVENVNLTNTVKEVPIKINNTINTEPVIKSLTLNMSEIKKHNTKSDCWMLINGKVYDITSYFGKHPGGNSTMSATCGIDATDAYMTQDPSATSSGSRSDHSSKAQSLLSNYYLGDFNQTISQ